MNLSDLFGGGGAAGAAWQSMFRMTTNGGTMPTVVKNQPGVLGGIYLNCPSGDGTVAQLEIYDKSSAPIVGTDVPVLSFFSSPWGANSTEEGVIFTPANGIRFYNGISIATTNRGTGGASNGSLVSLVYT